MATMNEKPIIFNTEMVRAILDGRKMQTRMPMKHQHTAHFDKAPYAVGDTLWVRETWAQNRLAENNLTKIPYRTVPCTADYIYRTDWDDSFDIKWHPPIYMPREAARLFLRVTDVRVEKLNDIDEDGVKAEGIEFTGNADELCIFAGQWNSIYSKRGLGWDANPWVWVISFERIKNV
jgi:hypothetical protein